MLKAAYHFIESGAVSSIRVSTRPDCLSEENLLLLQKYGVKTIELGVQSMDDEVLRKSGREYSKETVIEAVRLLKKYRFTVGIQLMPGLPGDTFEKSMTTAEEVIGLAPQFVRIYPTVVIKDTKLHDLYISGQYIPLSLDEGVRWSAESVRRFRKMGIEVIRVGLQSAPTLEEGGNIAAGPYHPSFGEMVESYLNYTALEAIVADRGDIEREVRVRVPQRELSAYIGNKGENRSRLAKRFNLGFTISGDETLEADSIVYEAGDGKEIIYNREYLLNAD
ncbi:MAG: radical SAM protein, partial [Nitrospinota bacterium]